MTHTRHRRQTIGAAADRLRHGDISSAALVAESLAAIDVHNGTTNAFTRIDADAAADGDQAFSLVKKFGGHAGELMVKYDAALEVTHIMLDVDGDKEADAIIDVAGKIKFDHFVL